MRFDFFVKTTQIRLGGKRTIGEQGSVLRAPLSTLRAPLSTLRKNIKRMFAKGKATFTVHPTIVGWTVTMT